MPNEAEKEGVVRIEATLTPEDLARTALGGVVQIQFVNPGGTVIATIPGTVVQTSEAEEKQIDGIKRRGVQISVSPTDLKTVYESLEKAPGDPKTTSVFFKGSSVVLGTLAEPKNQEPD